MEYLGVEGHRKIPDSVPGVMHAMGIVANENWIFGIVWTTGHMIGDIVRGGVTSWWYFYDTTNLHSYVGDEWPNALTPNWTA